MPGTPVLHVFGNASVSLAFNNTAYGHLGPWGGNEFSLAGGEAQRQIIMRRAGKFDRYSVVVSANTIATSSSTVRLRKNTANGNQILTIGAGVTGTFIDTQLSDTVADGDKVNVQLTTPNTSGSLTISQTSFYFTGDTTTTGIYSTNLAAPATNNLTRWQGFNSVSGASVNNTTANCYIRATGTAHHFQANSQTNGRAVVDTFKFYKNGANGNQTISTTASTTGFYEDTSNTDALASGDNYQIVQIFGASGSTINVLFSVHIDFTSRGYQVQGGAVSGITPGTTAYLPIAGIQNVFTLSEAQAQHRVFLPGTYSKLNFSVPINASNGSTTLRFRRNSANATQVITVNSGVTGNFEDSTHQDQTFVGDLINISANNAGSSGNSTLGMSSFLLSPTPNLLQLLGAG